MAGYSGTPLPKKLGIGEGSSGRAHRRPAGVIDDLPAGVRVKRQAGARQTWSWPSSPSGRSSSVGSGPSPP